MALSKKIENLVIKIDTKSYLVTIMQNRGNDFHKCVIEQFSCDKEMVDNKSFFDVLDNVLKVYLQDKHFSQPDVYIVLPDYAISLDQTTVPTMSIVKMKDALKTELKVLYKNFNEKETNSSIINKNKMQTIFSTTMVNKTLIEDSVAVCKKYNFNLKNISYESNSFVNSFFALSNKMKHQNFMLVNVAEKVTKIIFVSKEKTICFSELPYGTNFLSNDKLEFISNFQENMFAEYEIFSVKNANKEGIELNDFDSFKEYYESQKDIQKEQEKFICEQKNSKQTLMQKNFEKILRQVEGIAKSISSTYNFLQPEIAIINIPDKYSKAINNQDSFLKLTLLRNEIPEHCLLTDYLDLYGMVYAVIYNKGQNFIDHERQNGLNKFIMNLKLFFKSISTLFKKNKKKEK